MKKTYLSLLVIFTALIATELKAQNRYSFTILCRDRVDNQSSDDYIKVFSGFNGGAIDNYEEFISITTIRGIIGEAKSYYIQMLSPSGEVLEKSKIYSFYLEDIEYQEKLTYGWYGTYFKEEGTYSIECYIDDTLDSIMYFDVGDD